MEIRRIAPKSRCFSSLTGVFTWAAGLALAALPACQADPEGTGANRLPDGGMQRDADPSHVGGAEVPDAAIDAPDADEAQGGTEPPPPEEDASTPTPDAATETDAGVAQPDAALALPDAGEPPPPPGHDIRLAIEISNDVPESIYVQISDALGQPGWVTLEHEGQRYYIRERCDLQDCDGPPEGLCGPAEPLIRDVTAGTWTGTQEMLWDGIVSQFDASSGCELRGPAPEGAWKATFCFGLAAEFTAGAEPGETIPGDVLRPACVDVPFELPGDRDVVFSINGG